MKVANHYVNWGYKVFDHRRNEVEPLLLQVLKHGRSIAKRERICTGCSRRFSASLGVTPWSVP